MQPSTPDQRSSFASSRFSETPSVFSQNRMSTASTSTNYSDLQPMSQMPHISMMGGHFSASQHAFSNGLSSVPRRPQVTNMPSSPRTSRTLSTGLRPQARQADSEVDKKKKYFCTSCNKGFARKYDWKVHEQRYHEQQTQFHCPDCNQVLFAETLFKSHHRDAHSCQDCSQHAKEYSKDVAPERRRTAWGCGFCAELLDDWEKRCDHIASHYDNGEKKHEWDHTKVIIGLLRQPDVDAAWQTLLLEKNNGSQFPKQLGLRFSKESTGRSHGDKSMQLQDMLEFGACPRDTRKIAELTYSLGIRKIPTASSSIPEGIIEEETGSEAPSQSHSHSQSRSQPPPQYVNEAVDSADVVMGSPTATGPGADDIPPPLPNGNSMALPHTMPPAMYDIVPSMAYGGDNITQALDGHIHGGMNGGVNGAINGSMNGINSTHLQWDNFYTSMEDVQKHPVEDILHSYGQPAFMMHHQPSILAMPHMDKELPPIPPAELEAQMNGNDGPRDSFDQWTMGSTVADDGPYQEQHHPY
ncbi:hypothetical protein EJ06DRAFT_224757 [Trichodelitschia bisporula]|uniref:C2H2-type domain-containing protein n=1 Tax=Trichodelitschia bisporula TaxID=703511 RepID=A0A6G1HL40_9PEZI|nr:hypothetical protein EJ06DRAFT_224757 [Trichodelitschia bisporula]